jgi:multidrug transporter EmrE-like cation transporter
MKQPAFDSGEAAIDVLTEPVTQDAPGHQRLLLKALLLILFVAVCDTAGEVLVKVGASETANIPKTFEWLGFTGLLSVWVWAGIVCMITSLTSWMLVLKSVPLNIAFPLSNVVHVLVPLSSWWFLGETISPLRWGGIALVVTGLVVLAQPRMNMEERL